MSAQGQALLGGRSTSRVAALSPKHMAGRVRRALKCQAFLGAGSCSSMMGQRMASSLGVRHCVRRSAASQRGGRLVVKAM